MRCEKMQAPTAQNQDINEGNNDKNVDNGDII